MRKDGFKDGTGGVGGARVGYGEGHTFSVVGEWEITAKVTHMCSFYDVKYKSDLLKTTHTMSIKVEPVSLWSTFFLAAGASNVGQGE